MARLAQIALLMPIHSVACETGFSTLVRIKTKLRNMLAGRTLESLMMISILGLSASEMAESKFSRLCASLVRAFCSSCQTVV